MLGPVAAANSHKSLATVVARQLTERGEQLAWKVAASCDNVCYVEQLATGLWRFRRGLVAGPAKKTFLDKGDATDAAVREVRSATTASNRRGAVCVVDGDVQKCLAVDGAAEPDYEPVTVELKPVESGLDLRFLDSSGRQLGRAECPEEIRAALAAGKGLNAELCYARAPLEQARKQLTFIVYLR